MRLYNKYALTFFPNYAKIMMYDYIGIREENLTFKGDVYDMVYDSDNVYRVGIYTLLRDLRYIENARRSIGNL